MARCDRRRSPWAAIGLLGVVLAVGMSCAGCGSLVRKAAVATAEEPAEPVPPIAPQPSPEPDPPPASPDAACPLRVYAEPVCIHAYSREGITVDEHLEVTGCPSGGPFEMVVAGGCGTLKQVSGGGVQYYPPTREADAGGRVGEDTLEVTITCPHGVEATARMRVTILHDGHRSAVQAPSTDHPGDAPTAGPPAEEESEATEGKGRLAA